MEKIKSFINKSIEGEAGKDILTVAIVILVGLGSFGLGRLSKSDYSVPKVNYASQSANAVSTTSPTLPKVPSSLTQNQISGNYFASSRGQKYYTVGCTAGNTIKDENKIYFTTEADAVKAGYEKSTSCK